jgi:threonyl-tRNA synthetase
MTENLDKMRHSLSHIMAQAVLELYPDAKLTIGPAIETGFYYDFDLGGRTFEKDDLKKIEKAMHHIVNQGQSFEAYELPVAEAKEKLAANPYKLELIDELAANGETKINFYRNLDAVGKVCFSDMCRGPHLASTKEVGAFKLDKVAGAYWRGDEKRQMLQRVYGLAFETTAELEEYLQRREEAEKRDHRKLGKELGLFIFSELVGPGLPIYTFKGNIVREEIIKYSEELQTRIGYQQVHTPNINKADLFRVSGHYDLYKNDMLQVHSHYTDEEYYLKPMNCPQHTQVFASELRSYKDLPIRISDFANIYRDEKPGELSGLSRLRCFAQDDGHCFCREDQIEEEFKSVLEIIKEALTTYNLKYHVRLSLWDEARKSDYIGGEEIWDKAQKKLRDILVSNNMEFVVGEGEAAFYGPKMDIMAFDALGREWQISTIQLDFNMPNRFGLKYIDSDGQEKTPVMIHRAIVGSPDRFMSILIEHYGGAFPTWLSPVQVKVISVGAAHVARAQEVAAALKSSKVRVAVADDNETVGYKIRSAEKEKIPYMIVIGDREVESGQITIRERGVVEQSTSDLSAFIENLTTKIQKRLS